MAKEFIPLYLDFNDTTQDLTDEECGRLIRALMHYVNDEEYESLLQGSEKVAFRFMKGFVDRNNALSEARAKAGAKGGEQTQANASKRKQHEANDNSFKQAQANASKNAININTNINKEANINSSIEQFLLDDDAHEIQSEQNRVLDAAEDAGFKMSNNVRAALINLYADHGLQKMLDGFRSCSDHGAPTLAYLKAVLSGKPKKQDKPKVIAQDFNQRDYADVNDDLMSSLAKDMDEFKKGVG